MRRSPEDFERVARELVRAMRGRRSQLLLSRKLGYSTNAVYTWEAGSAWPTAARFFELAHHVGVRLDDSLARFFRTRLPRLRGVSLRRPEGVRRLLEELVGHLRITTLARDSGLTRFAISRWLSGKGEPKLPEFLRIVEHTSFRMLDLIDTLVTPDALPSIRAEWQQLQAARNVGYEHPMTHAVLRVLETASYRAARHASGRVARMLGISDQEEELCLRKLREAGQIRWARARWVPGSAAMVDFRRDPELAQQLKAFWAALAADRTRARRPGLSAYNVFAVSRADLERLETLQRDTLRQMRSIIAASEPSEVVALANFQIFDLGPGESPPG